jgi:hypothetical protein
MTASYPTSSKSFTTKVTGETFMASYVNDMQTEVTAIETDLLAAKSWTAPTLTNSWANYGSGYNPAGYRKTTDGMVHVRGLIASGTMAVAAFTLPTGYRPPYDMCIPAMANGVSSYAAILKTGLVIPYGASSAWFSLDNIYFTVF